MKPKYKNFSLVRGDTMEFGLEFRNTDMVPDEIWFSVKQSDDVMEYVFQKSLGDGITRETDGSYTIRIEPEDTQELEAGTYFYDIEWKSGNDVHTPYEGDIKLLADRTRRPLVPADEEAEDET